MPFLTSVSIPFGCLAYTILGMSYPQFLSLFHPLQRRKDGSPGLLLDHQPQAPHTPTCPSLNPSAVLLHLHPNPPTLTANTIPPPTGHLPRLHVPRMAHLLLPVSQSGTCVWRDLTMSDNWEGIACPPCPGSSPASSAKRSWPWGGEKTWSSDSGWGC